MQLKEKGKIIFDEETGVMKRVRRYMNGTKNSTEFHHEQIADLKNTAEDLELIPDPVAKGIAKAAKKDWAKPASIEQL